MDNFTPDPSYCVDINPITWETVIYKYKEHNKQCIKSFIDPDIKVEFRGCASHGSEYNRAVATPGPMYITGPIY